jgi:hypothetical protein
VLNKKERKNLSSRESIILPVTNEDFSSLFSLTQAGAKSLVK